MRFLLHVRRTDFRIFQRALRRTALCSSFDVSSTHPQGISWRLPRLPTSPSAADVRTNVCQILISKCESWLRATVAPLARCSTLPRQGEEARASATLKRSVSVLEIAAAERFGNFENKSPTLCTCPGSGPPRLRLRELRSEDTSLPQFVLCSPTSKIDPLMV